MASARESRSRRPTGPAEPAWAAWTDEEILDLRFCDLGLTLRGTWVEPLIARLHSELEQRGIRFKPHAWLSNEWFSPDGVPGIAVPFYLAHPRLMKLERRQMLQVEGGTKPWCMRILRHEAGHAFDTAHRLRRKRAWREVFGRSSRTYPETYRAKAENRNFVLHLDWWYAQSHPCEDFAETFAVWLRPGSRWRSAYRGWPVLRKLQYVESVVEELGARAAPVRSREYVEPLSALKGTLRKHYLVRRGRYCVDLPDFYDRQLEQVFAPGRAAKPESAATFLLRVGPELCRRVVSVTGTHPYTVAQFLRLMTMRVRRLKLRRSRSERHVKLEVAILLAAQVLGYVYEGGHHIAL